MGTDREVHTGAKDKAVLSIGVDLATRAKSTAEVGIHWHEGGTVELSLAIDPCHPGQPLSELQEPRSAPSRGRLPGFPARNGSMNHEGHTILAQNSSVVVDNRQVTLLVDQAIAWLQRRRDPAPEC